MITWEGNLHGFFARMYFVLTSFSTVQVLSGLKQRGDAHCRLQTIEDDDDDDDDDDDNDDDDDEFICEPGRTEALETFGYNNNQHKQQQQQLHQIYESQNCFWNK